MNVKKGYVHNENFPDGNIEGFDIDLDEQARSRIDRLVNTYEELIVKGLEEEYARKTTKSDKVADKVAAFGGSWKFIVIMGTVLVFWVVWNALPFTPFHFDPGPYILLNLVLSFTAAFQAPIIMMSQNRQAARDKNESIIDFAINYKAEQEIDSIQSHLHRMEVEMMEIKELIVKMNENKGKDS